MTQEEHITTEERSYRVVLARDPAGGYVVTCPALPGVVTEGDTLEEAHTNAAEAILLYLEDLQADGLPIPQSENNEADIVIDHVRVSLPA
jgi:predicted RNase H-like HicB family nuclease